MLTVLRQADPSLWLSEARTSTGRGAIRHLARMAKIRRAWVPEYCPEGVIDPLRREGVDLMIYGLDERLDPVMDGDGLEPTDLFVLINYFGFPAKFAKPKPCLLLEDLAQALYLKPRAEADFALWSLNKFLPVCDGAVLRSRRSDIDVGERPSSMFARRSPDDLAMKYYRAHLAVNRLIVDGKDVGSEIGLSQALYEQYYAAMSADQYIYAQSDESRMIEKAAPPQELERAQSARRIHCELPASFVWRDPRGLAPMALPILVPEHIPLDAAVTALLEIGVMAARQIDHWQVSYVLTFVRRHLLLPVLGITEEAAKKIGACLRELEGQWQSRSSQRSA